MASIRSHHGRRVAARTAAALALACAAVAASAGSATADPPVNPPVQFSVRSTSGSFVLKKGDPTYERTISNPDTVLSAQYDETTGQVSANLTFQPSYTPNIAGPFGFVIYIKAQVIQTTPLTGTVSNTGAIDVSGTGLLAIGVYRTLTGTVGQSDGQNPATDQVIALSSTCRSQLSLHLTGQFDIAARSFTAGQDQFAIPNFPADTRSTGGNAGCTLATNSLNQQLAGPNNSVSLTFGGTPVAGGFAPEAPGRATAIAGNGSAVVSAAIPSDYGSPIQSYTVTPYIGDAAQPAQVLTPSSGPVTITGLTNGTTYTFTVAATNAYGTGPASPASNPVTVGAPAWPGFQSATAQPGGATLKWWAPNNNGSPITGYTVTPYIGGVAQAPQIIAGTSNVVPITGLTAGTTYTFRIAATNANGTGIASGFTNAVTPT